MQCCVISFLKEKILFCPHVVAVLAQHAAKKSLWLLCDLHTGFLFKKIEMDMFNIIAIILPVFGIILLGFLSVYLKLVAQEQFSGMGLFVIKVALPCLLLVSVSKQNITDLWQPQYLLSYGIASLIIFLSLLYYFARYRAYALNHSALYAMGGAMSNTGFIGGAVLYFIIGPSAAVYFAMTFMVENFLIFLLFLICLELHHQRGEHPFKIVLHTLSNIIKNPIIIALVLGVLLSALNLQLPSLVVQMLEPVGKTAGALGLFLVGTGLYGIRDFHSIDRDAGIIIGSKMLCMPLLVYALFLCMPNAQPEMIFAGVLLSSISMVAMFGVFGQNFQLGQKSSAILLLCTSANILTISTVMALFAH